MQIETETYSSNSTIIYLEKAEYIMSISSIFGLVPHSFNVETKMLTILGFYVSEMPFSITYILDRKLLRDKNIEKILINE